MPYDQAKDMELIPESKDKFPAAEMSQRCSSRERNKPERLTYHLDTIQDLFAYNVNLDIMDEYGTSYYWKIQDILGHKIKRHQSIYLKIEWIDGEKSWESLDISSIMNQRKS